MVQIVPGSCNVAANSPEPCTEVTPFFQTSRPRGRDSITCPTKGCAFSQEEKARVDALLAERERRSGLGSGSGQETEPEVEPDIKTES